MLVYIIWFLRDLEVKWAIATVKKRSNFSAVWALVSAVLKNPYLMQQLWFIKKQLQREYLLKRLLSFQMILIAPITLKINCPVLLNSLFTLKVVRKHSSVLIIIEVNRKCWELRIASDVFYLCQTYSIALQSSNDVISVGNMTFLHILEPAFRKDRCTVVDY